MAHDHNNILYLKYENEINYNFVWELKLNNTYVGDVAHTFEVWINYNDV